MCALTKAYYLPIYLPFSPHTEPTRAHAPPITMLKWTLNKRIEPIAQVAAVLKPGRVHKRRSMGGHPLQSATAAARDQQTRRKSVATAEATRRYRSRHNKENIVIASPHPISMRAGVQTTSTPYAHQATALRDVGNKTPTRRSLNAVLDTTPLRKRHLPPSPLFNRSQTMSDSPSAGVAPHLSIPSIARISAIRATLAPPNNPLQLSLPNPRALLTRQHPHLRPA